MSTTRKVTTGILLAVVAGLIGYDCFAYASAGVDSTISSVIWASAKSPALTFAAGFLAGHLWWNSSSGVSSGN